jgi:hypothetical protein
MPHRMWYRHLPQPSCLPVINERHGYIKRFADKLFSSTTNTVPVFKKIFKTAVPSSLGVTVEEDALCYVGEQQAAPHKIKKEKQNFSLKIKIYAC